MIKLASFYLQLKQNPDEPLDPKPPLDLSFDALYFSFKTLSSPQLAEASPSSPTPDFPLSSPPSTPTAQFSPSLPQTPPSSPLPSHQNHKRNNKYHNPNFVNTTTLHPIPNTLEPTTHTQAQKDPQWRQAMEAEFNALIHNQTWELVPPKSHHPIGCDWVFRIKRKPDGSIDKYKGRLVAKGFHQQYRKDYFDTFSPVTKHVTIRTILSIAFSNDSPLRQLDINNALLQGTLYEEVFMTQRPGYTHPQFPNHICKLKKSIYGLKQASGAWYTEVASFLFQFGFRKSLADVSLFIYSSNGIICYFMVYVDDIVLTGNTPEFLSRLFLNFHSPITLMTFFDSNWDGVNDAGATYMCANPVYHSRVKHMVLDYHFVREKVYVGLLRVHHVHSQDQLADMLTKPLSRALFLRNRSKIRVSGGSSISRGRIKDNGLSNPLDTHR
uniref:Reverse transcriptase Ty1/copia-type domain-containing protein n=1 Tax=Lactuca sativa TaxID=4236 RepID=A0A9R1VFN7_LACSA|nr:hypothetical protein LSAT_V11C500272260 [Lactuca sativa]